MPTIWNKRVSAPEGAIYVGRPGKWGNPFIVGTFHQGRRMTRGDAVEAFKIWLIHSDEGVRLQADIGELKGKDLVCWCVPLLCHASVLLEIANR